MTGQVTSNQMQNNPGMTNLEPKPQQKGGANETTKKVESIKESINMHVTFGDFIPWGSWTVVKEGPVFSDDQAPMYIKNDRTGKPYWNQPDGLLRFKNFLTLTLASLGHALTMPANAIYRLAKVITFANYWSSEKPITFKASLKESGKDLLRIALTPIAYVGLELISLYGIIGDARNSSKVYDAIERSIYGEDGWKWAPCFAPDPDHHFFGGDPN